MTEPHATPKPEEAHATCGPTHHAYPCTHLFEELRAGAAWLVEGVTDTEGVSLAALAAVERSLDALERFEVA